MAKSLQNFRAALNSVVNGVDARLNSGHYVQVSKKHGRRSRRNSNGYPKVFKLDDSYLTVNSQDQETEAKDDYGASEVPIPAKAVVRTVKGSAATLSGDTLKNALAKGASITSVVEEGAAHTTSSSATATATRPTSPAAQPQSQPPRVSPPATRTIYPESQQPFPSRIPATEIMSPSLPAPRGAPSRAIPTIESILPRYNEANYIKALDDMRGMNDREVLESASSRLKPIISTIFASDKDSQALFINMSDPSSLAGLLEKLTGNKIKTWREIYYLNFNSSDTDLNQPNVAWLMAILRPEVNKFEQSQEAEGGYYLGTTYFKQQSTLLYNIFTTFNADLLREMRNHDLASVKEYYNRKDIDTESQEAKKQINRCFFEPGHLLNYLGWPLLQGTSIFNELKKELKDEKILSNDIPFNFIEQPLFQNVPTGKLFFSNPPGPVIIQAKMPRISPQDAAIIAGGLARTWITQPIKQKTIDFIAQKGITLALDPQRCPPDLEGSLTGMAEDREI